MGPMQFLPGTWARYASDGDGDGKADLQNVYDASLAAARYLCSGGLNLRDQSQVLAAILRYNNSMAYAHNVLGWAAAYATGVVPVDLPPITGPSQRWAPRCDNHLDHPRASDRDFRERHRPACQRPAVAVAADGADRCGQPDHYQRAGIRPGQSLGPLPGPATALAQAPPQPVPRHRRRLPPWVQPQQQPRCAVFCIQSTVPPAAPPELRRPQRRWPSRSSAGAAAAAPRREPGCCPARLSARSRPHRARARSGD